MAFNIYVRRKINEGINMLEAKIKEWLSKITEEGNLPDKCKAIYIGLFENAEKRYMIHFLGSVDFDDADDDWACEDDDDYYPKNRYLDSDISTQTNWEEFQKEVVDIIKLIRSKKDTILSTVEHIGVGFNSGKLENI